MDQKFKELKTKFAEKPIRAYPRYGLNECSFELAVDFSGENLAAVLSQEQHGQPCFMLST